MQAHADVTASTTLAEEVSDLRATVLREAAPILARFGPGLAAAVELLGSLLARMDQHIRKKTPTLRALKSW